MTVKEKIIKMLTDRLLSDRQAESIMESAMPHVDHLIKDYKMTWNSPADQYPNLMYGTLWMVIKPIAYKWIDRNLPEAFFKSMFAENSDI